MSYGKADETLTLAKSREAIFLAIRGGTSLIVLAVNEGVAMVADDLVYTLASYFSLCLRAGIHVPAPPAPQQHMMNL